MSVERLQRIVSPPENPREIPDVQQWNTVESKIISLPQDYRDYIHKYGTGSLDSFIWIFNPGSNNPNLNLNKQVDRQLEAIRGINASGLEPVITLFPDQPGVLPFGLTDNGDVLLWETKGEPSEWTVSVLPARSSPLIQFSMSMTDFLAGVCEGSVRCEAFPEDFPSANPDFVPKS